MTEEPKLTKLHVDLPNHQGVDGETMWARSLGGDLYELRNIPFFAYGLNHRDVVRAMPNASDSILEIRQVVRPSGHRTYRVFFTDRLPDERRPKLLDSLRVLHVFCERATAVLFALDLRPDADEDTVFELLDGWEASGLLYFETCEARRPGSFDDHPDPDVPPDPLLNGCTPRS